jgi:D-lactate dehydrogenase
VHPACSARKAGLADPLVAIVARSTSQVVTVDEVPCCGLAGDRGFAQPELPPHALRHLKAALPAGCASGVPSGRTCAIGLAELAGGRYRSFVQLVDGCAMPLEAAVEVSA